MRGTQEMLKNCLLKDWRNEGMDSKCSLGQSTRQRLRWKWLGPRALCLPPPKAPASVASSWREGGGTGMASPDLVTRSFFLKHRTRRARGPLSLHSNSAKEESTLFRQTHSLAKSYFLVQEKPRTSAQVRSLPSHGGKQRLCLRL